MNRRADVVFAVAASLTGRAGAWDSSVATRLDVVFTTLRPKARRASAVARTAALRFLPEQIGAHAGCAPNPRALLIRDICRATGCSMAEVSCMSGAALRMM